MTRQLKCKMMCILNCPNRISTNTGSRSTRKIQGSLPGSPTSQLRLFQSLFRSIKAADQSAEILPIRNDVKIFPQSTSNQILNLEHIGLTHYFKPYKKSQKTLAGDYYVQTKLDFEAFKDHQAINTWLMQYGYNLTKNSCQTADMVCIGYLSRIRGFTLRCDFQDYIMASPEWKEAPFHFRLYYDAMGSKGRTIHILMIDVDRPNIELGLQFFQRWFNGSAPNSPNNIAYMFWPLYRKTYSKEDRLHIIIDHLHHLGTDSVVAIKGLHPLETLIQLINGVHTTIRRLLLSMPAPGTATGKIFTQVERQLTSYWFLGCFQTSDAEKVTLRLSTLKDSLRKVTHPDSHNKLFLSEAGLSFNGQVASMIKGKNKLPCLDVPEPTAHYVHQSMQRLDTPSIKRQAIEIDQDMQDEPMVQHIATPVPRQVPTTFTTIITTPTSTISTAKEEALTREMSENPIIQKLQQTANNHLAALLDLQECCTNLMQSQQTLTKQIADMNAGITHKFEAMSASIVNLKLSPTRHCQKIHKNFHRAGPEENLL